jgi:hypothetical protein
MNFNYVDFGQIKPKKQPKLVKRRLEGDPSPNLPVKAIFWQQSFVIS